MNIEDKGFILKKVEYGDYDFIATIYTEKLGKTSFIIKNARKSKKRFVGKLEPFNLIILNFKNTQVHESAKTLNSIQLDTQYSNHGLNKNIIILSSLVNEYVDTFEIKEVANTKTFNILEKFFLNLPKKNLIEALDGILEFQINYLTIHGLKPTHRELERIIGEKISLEKNKITRNVATRVKLIKIIAKFSQFHSGKELNSIQYLDLL
ncbi:DNA repair protein RecO [bacterium]|nr:DNA repair protein RecO [bacterium]|tara:strand:+ start:14304 stop:14927 length:624 start_codon:yes stop_codon:yes gene_type:complete